MGHPKFPRKQFETPKHPWKEERIKSERELMKKYGLKSHREIWKAKTHLGRYRGQARELLAKIGTKNPQIKKESDQLLLHLTRMGILQAGANLDDILALEIESVLSRRLQTLVYLKGFSETISHSRQLINHGHITIDNQKISIPGYIVPKDQEVNIRYTGRSPLNELSHPARPKSDTIISRTTPPIKEEEGKEKTEPTEKIPTKPLRKDQSKPQEKTEPAQKEEKQKESEPSKEQTSTPPTQTQKTEPSTDKQPQDQPKKPQEKQQTEDKKEQTDKNNAEKGEK